MSSISRFGSLTMLASLVCLQAVQAATPGAIFTTIANGSIVNANTQYASKCDVYLDGGPGPNAPAKAAGLAAGDYYFQVTDPSGNTLLSTDPVSNRRFTVNASGVISAFAGTGGPSIIHPTGIDQDHSALGAVTIRVANSNCPSDFADTPNQGGVYKVWATKTTDFTGNPALVDSPCSGGGCFHGFLNSKSKTDNFKALPTLVTYCVNVTTQLQTGKPPNVVITAGANWGVDITDPLGVVNHVSTDANGKVAVCGLTGGVYTVTQIPPPGIIPSTLTVTNGTGTFDVPADFLYSFTLSSPVTIVFTDVSALQ
jgi:hypothetical protein